MLATPPKIYLILPPPLANLATPLPSPSTASPSFPPTLRLSTQHTLSSALTPTQRDTLSPFLPFPPSPIQSYPIWQYIVGDGPDPPFLPSPLLPNPILSCPILAYCEIITARTPCTAIWCSQAVTINLGGGCGVAGWVGGEEWGVMCVRRGGAGRKGDLRWRLVYIGSLSAREARAYGDAYAKRKPKA